VDFNAAGRCALEEYTDVLCAGGTGQNTCNGDSGEACRGWLSPAQQKDRGRSSPAQNGLWACACVPLLVEGTAAAAAAAAAAVRSIPNHWICHLPVPVIVLPLLPCLSVC
jgi:hypothetical protein